jgi:hypothetical protein
VAFWRDRFEKAKTQNFIVDRGPIDEFVYGPLLRGTMVYRSYEIEDMIQGLKSPHVQSIVCQIPIEDQLKSFHEREQLSGTREHIQQINNWFRYLYMVYPFQEAQCVFYDYTREQSYEILKRILWRPNNEREGRGKS